MFENEVAEAISKHTNKRKEVVQQLLERPPKPEMGDYAFPCFVLAKEQKTKPGLVAEHLAKQIRGALFAKVEAHGPFLNFFLQPGKVAERVLGAVREQKEGFGGVPAKKHKVMVEFSQPNTHKEFHVGHLRNVFLGESIARLMERDGSKVIRANYIGDVGAHVAKCLWNYLNFHQDDEVPDNKGKYLGKLYTEASKKLEKNPDWKQAVSELLQKLENGDKPMKRVWKKTRKWSLEEFDRIYKELGIDFDVVFYESEVEKEGKVIVRDLLKKGVAKKDEGAVLIDLETYGLHKFLLLKQDGTSLYSTKDLALAQKKFAKYDLDESIYVVDSRQKLYFQQLFKTLELLGFTKKLIHVPYEFVSLKEGVISSRTGVVALYEDVRDAMLFRAEQEVKKRHKDWSAKKVSRTAFAITTAAMAFSFLKIESNKVIVFDPEEALEFEGETGPYVQYTHARISSILKKQGTPSTTTTDVSFLQEPEEHLLMKTLMRFPDVCSDAAKQYKPSLVARYLIELCQKTNEYYHKHHILKAEPARRDARLVLMAALQHVIRQGLALLNIAALDAM